MDTTNMCSNTNFVWLCVCAHLVYESPECGEHVSYGGFGLPHFKEGQVDVKHFPHQGVVTVTVQQLGLERTKVFIYC